MTAPQHPTHRRRLRTGLVGREEPAVDQGFLVSYRITAKHDRRHRLVGGVWGEPGNLHVPLNDRGLQLGDGLFETVLIRDGIPQLLGDHLARWRGSAELLGMDDPPERIQLESVIA